MSHGAIPLPGPSSCSSVPLVLPRLVDFRSHGAETAILGFIDLFDMSSPLYRVFLWFSNSRVLAARALVNATKQILAAYYERQGLNHPRKVNRIKILYHLEKRRLIFKFRSYPTPASNHKPNLTPQFDGIGTQAGTKTAEAFPLFPWDDAREFTAEGWSIDEGRYRGMFRRMKDFSHLRLENLDISPVLRALSSEIAVRSR